MIQAEEAKLVSYLDSIVRDLERRIRVRLGLYTPQHATLQVIEAETPRQTSTEQIEATNRIHSKRLPRPDEPTTILSCRSHIRPKLPRILRAKSQNN